MGLYDNYKLRNSNAILKYQGAPVDEMAKVGSFLQESYMVNKDKHDTLEQSIDTANILESDRGLFKERMGTVRTALSEAAKAGNYEDMSMQTRQLGRQFNADYQPFVQNRAAMLAEDEAMAKGIVDGKYDSHTIDRVKRARGIYGGLKIGEDGQYTNQYKARTLANYVDVDDKIRKAVLAIPAEKLSKSGHGGTVSIAGGQYMIKSERGTEIVSPERIREVTAQVMADPMISSYMKQDAELNYAHLSKLNYEDLPGEDNLTQQRYKRDKDGNPILLKGSKTEYEKEDYSVSTVKGMARKLAEQQGIPFVDAYKQVAAQYEYSNKVRGYQDSFVSTNEVNNITTKDDVGSETGGSIEARGRRQADYEQKLANDAAPVFEGAVSNNPEKSYDEVTRSLATTQTNIEGLRRQLANGKLGTQDKANVTAQIAQLEQEHAQTKVMLRTTAGEKLKDMPDKIPVRLYSGNWSDFGGKAINLSKETLLQAFANGKVSKVGGTTYVETKQGRVVIEGDSLPVAALKAFTSLVGGIVDKAGSSTGTQLPIGKAIAGGVNNLVGSSVARAQDRINSSTDKIMDQVAGNSTYSNQSSINFGLNKAEIDGVSKNILSDPNGYEMMDKDNNPVSGVKGIKITSMSSQVGPNGKNYLLGSDEDGNPIKVLPKGQSDLEQRVGARSNGIIGNRVIGELSKTSLNSPITLDRPLKLEAGVEAHGVMTKQTPNGALGYYLLDKSGQVLKDPNGGDVYSADMAVIAKLITQK